MTAICYTDGSCSKNPGPGGYACYILLDGRKYIGVGNKQSTTNNEMELKAILLCLKMCKKYGINEAKIHSDSAYVVNSINQKWLIGWKTNGWKTGQDKEIKNKEIWQEIYERLKEGRYEFIKVKGHNGVEGNVFADKYANYAREKKLHGIKELKQ